MTHVAVGTTVPEIYIATNRNRQKIYRAKRQVDNTTKEINEIYLKDGSNFEIELYNNQNETIGFEIMMNGRLISNSLIILKPAQRYFLDRFIDTNNKFLFETYKVENTQQNKDIIQNNGRITVRCYKEQFFSNYHTWVGTVTIPYYNPYYYQYTYYPYYNGSVTLSGNCTSGSATYTNGIYTNGSCTTMNIDSSTPTSFTVGNGNINAVYTNCSSTQVCMDSMSAFNTSSVEIETGKIEKGDASQQTFESVHFNKSFNHFHEMEYFISPISMMNRNPENIKIHCHECGYRLRKKTFKFCPNCGTKQ